MPLPPYPLVCYRPGCGQSAPYKIAARWSDGVTCELKTYALSCEGCLADQYRRALAKQAACRVAPGESLELPGIYLLARGQRDHQLVRRADLEEQFSPPPRPSPCPTGRCAMRTCALPLLLTAWFHLPARGDDDKAARAVLDRAIQAAGGARLLSGKPALTGTSRGTLQLGGKRTAVTNEWTVQGTDQLKWTSALTLNDNPTSIVIVVNGDKGWVSGNNQPANPIPKEQLVAFREGMRGLRLAETLVPLVGKEYTLSSLGELKINGTPAVGVKAKKKGAAELDLWFDKKTGLPLKAEMRVKDGSEEAAWAAYFSDYKKVAGRQHFTGLRIERDGKKVVEMKRGDIKARDRVDEATFGKP